MSTIPGYDFGASRVARSPVRLEELRQLEETVGWTAEDAKALEDASVTLCAQAEAMVDSWRAQIAKQPHLAKVFFDPVGKPDETYKAAVKKRFVQWVKDTCTRPRDQAWLDYQEEIGLRHTPAKKNKTDGAQTPSVVPLRYLLAFTSQVLTSIKEFLPQDRSPSELDAMQWAWTKSVLLQITLWSRPYTQEDLW